MIPIRAQLRNIVKKLLLLVIAGVVGYVVFTKVKGQQSGQDLWSEATDSVN